LLFSALLRGFDSIRGGVTTAVPQGVEQAMSIIGKWCNNISIGNIIGANVVHYAAKCRNFYDDLSKNLLHLKCFCDMLMNVENI